MEKEEVLTLKEVSRYLKVSQESLRTLIKERKIPVSKVGVQYRFQKSLIDLWLRLQALKSFEDPDELISEESRNHARQILNESPIDAEEKQFLIRLISRISTRPTPEEADFQECETDFPEDLEESFIL